MNKYERSRLSREKEYLRGLIEALSWVTLTNPSDEQIDSRIDKIDTRMQEIDIMLKRLNKQP